MARLASGQGPLLYGPCWGDRGGRRDRAGLAPSSQGSPRRVRVTQGPSVGDVSDGPFVPPNAQLCVLSHTVCVEHRDTALVGAEKNGRTVPCY